MKFDLNLTKVVEEIVMQAKENQEEFIFKTIRPYCENILQMKINKEELKHILLNGTQQQQPKIDEIIKRIEETRDKDKLCEYPYNRCINIVREVLGND